MGQICRSSPPTRTQKVVWSTSNAFEYDGSPTWTAAIVPKGFIGVCCLWWGTQHQGRRFCDYCQCLVNRTCKATPCVLINTCLCVCVFLCIQGEPQIYICVYVYRMSHKSICVHVHRLSHKSICMCVCTQREPQIYTERAISSYICVRLYRRWATNLCVCMCV
jgi:hypothetical protein